MAGRKSIPPSIAEALKRRRRYVWCRRFFAVALVASAFVDNALSHGDDWSNFDHRQFTCTGAVDVQTITINTGQRVRLLGVAGCTPRFDTLATANLAKYIGRSVTLKLEPTQTRDDQGRLLAWVFLQNQTTLNAALVSQGLALADRPNPSTLLTSIEQAEREARSKNRGLWAEVDNWEMPAWRRQWTAQQRDLRQKLQSSAAGG
jgi:endonuclease YncB( thermonuclease family)